MSALVKNAGIGAITLFTEDLERSKQFYLDVFGLPVAFGFRVHHRRGRRGCGMRGAGPARSGLLNGPMNRPWGIRTASFADPDGHIWELAQALP